MSLYTQRQHLQRPAHPSSTCQDPHCRSEASTCCTVYVKSVFDRSTLKGCQCSTRNVQREQAGWTGQYALYTMCTQRQRLERSVHPSFGL